MKGLIQTHNPSPHVFASVNIKHISMRLGTKYEI